MSRLTASRAAFDLIASFEGFRTRAVRTPNGQWTLGFGHSATAREGLTVTRVEAEDLLRWDLLPIEDMIRQVALTPLSQNQFDALVSFAFNIGLENFRTSDVLKYLNQGQPVAAALSMHAWRRASVNGRVLTIDALVRRRASESALFLETIGARPAAPTSIVRPQIDYSAALLSHPADTTEFELEAEVETGTEHPTSQEDVSARDEGEVSITPTVTMREKASEDSVLASATILPVMPMPPLQDLMRPIGQTKHPLSDTRSTVAEGVQPFPQSQDQSRASGNYEAIIFPANDQSATSLDIAPDVQKSPHILRNEVSDRVPLVVWGLMVLGAALLAFGLYYSWKSGILSVNTPRREPNISELSALLAAASGFILLVTSAVSAFMSDQDKT